jgi:3-isopropylmalate/(R)-2-methylmalate dehydratase small subunit
MVQQGEPVDTVEGRALPLPGNDIDTDQIIPARFMKVVTFEGLGQYAFNDARWDESGNPKEHPFNDERFQGASVLLVNRNFGSGSSREHAPQALARSGIKAVVGESFAEIFAGNCTAMGVPAITLPQETVQKLMRLVEEQPETWFSIDLRENTMTVRGKETSEQYEFDLPPAYRNALLGGTWDSTSVLLSHLDEIRDTAEQLPYLNNFE